MLEIKDLAVQYGKQDPTIEHFNLSMKKGEIISIVGESGSGKTTVIRAVLGALRSRPCKLRRYSFSWRISSEKYRKRVEKDPWK